MNRQYHPSDIKPKRPFVPQPSLHIGLMRDDPWNEFLQHSPVSGEDLLSFKSSSEAENRALRERLNSQLTVVAGERPALAVPPLVTFPNVSLPNVSSFLFSQIKQLPLESVAVVAQPNEPVADSSSALPEPAPEVGKSLWDRMHEALESFRKVSQASLPKWFENEQALVIPSDPEIRSVLGSIYGGLKTRIVVTVRVIEAIDVPALDFWGTSDPYVTVCLVRGVGGLTAGRLGLLPTIGVAKSCNPKFATLNPKWNESIALDPADFLSVISDSVLHISMWDKDVIKADDPVGFTTVSLIDALEASGASPYPILPIQVTGSLIGPHAGVFVKIQLRMVQKVGVVSVTPIAVQGFTRGWTGYTIRLEVKVTASDPIASPFYMTESLTGSSPECSLPVTVNETGHAMWPKSVAPLTILFSSQSSGKKSSKPFLHITMKTDDAVGGDAGQIAIRMGMLERLGGITGVKLNPLEGSPGAEVLSRCLLYTGVECQLID